MKKAAEIRILGDSAIIVKFAKDLQIDANERAINFAKFLRKNPPANILEIASFLVSTFIRYDNLRVNFASLMREIRLALLEFDNYQPKEMVRQHKIKIHFDGEDLYSVCEKLGLTKEEFIKLHNKQPLRVLSTGFAPGFLYCGMHEKSLHIARKTEIKNIKRGAVIFAAGQTAISATSIPTGWHHIGHTDFINFDINKQPPIFIKSGEKIIFLSE